VVRVKKPLRVCPKLAKPTLCSVAGLILRSANLKKFYALLDKTISQGVAV
jgi:hypothetical protein